MSRNATFESPGRQALVSHPQARLEEDRVTGPIPFFNPTRARFDLPSSETAPIDAPSNSNAGATAPPVGDAQYEWRSRDNRKGKESD